MVDNHGYEIGLDATMRTKRRRFASITAHLPKRYLGRRPLAVVMPRNASSRLADGSISQDHDDWDCLIDMQAAGLFENNGIETAQMLRLTPLGYQIVAALKRLRAERKPTAAMDQANILDILKERQTALPHQLREIANGFSVASEIEDHAHGAGTEDAKDMERIADAVFRAADLIDRIQGETPSRTGTES
jgi:hypothetical protein